MGRVKNDIDGFFPFLATKPFVGPGRREKGVNGRYCSAFVKLRKLELRTGGNATGTLAAMDYILALPILLYNV